MSTIRVEHVADDQFDVHVAGHVLRVDQPVAVGGADTGPTPTDLFVASLAACIAFYARRYLSRHGLPTEGLLVTATATTADKPHRVSRIEVEVTLPEGFPAERTDALLAVASRCTVHTSLLQPPAVEVTATAAPGVAPAA